MPLPVADISQGKTIFSSITDIAVYFGACIIGQRGNCEEFACFPSVALKIMGAATQRLSHIYFDASARNFSQGKTIFRSVTDIAVYFGAHIIGQRANCEEFACFPSVALERMGAATQFLSHIYFDASDISKGKTIFRSVTYIAVYFGAHIIDQRRDCEVFACVPSVALKNNGCGQTVCLMAFT